MIRKKLVALILLVSFLFLNIESCVAIEFDYPDYAYEFLGQDKHENFNRKMFNFNLGLNKYAIKPIHTLWATIIPQYGMDRIFGISNNIEYPIRLVSSLVQRDFKNAGRETARFFINTTIGLAGMFDPTKHLLKFTRSRDNMDKALARCNIKSGMYFVAPVINFTTIRGLFGRLLDMALNPSTYIGTPILAIIKAAIMINRTTYLQAIVQLIEINFDDPYYIAKLAFGIDSFIKKNNYDRVEITNELFVKEADVVIEDETVYRENQTNTIVSAKIAKDSTNSEKTVKKQKNDYEEISIKPDIYLKDYAPQAPVVDSMRTFLFEFPEVRKSIWNELSPWNRSFAKRFKVSSVILSQGREKYEFKYRLQKNKNAPLAIIYPSTGDGIDAGHPMMFAKLFYDAGYSVVIEGNPFRWEFVRSMPESYKPGLPSKDAKAMRIASAKIIEKLEKKYGTKFNQKVIFGTSLAGLDVLYMAQQEEKENTLGDTKFIAICPPVNLMYSVDILDNYAMDWVKYKDLIKPKVAFASAKLVKLYQSKDDIKFPVVNHLPFDEDEAKLFTSFVMHEKLANVVFEIEKAPTNKKSDIYEKIDKMGYFNYFVKYLMPYIEQDDRDIEHGFGLGAISSYLANNDNYKIYHTRNDYLINQNQLKQLKYMAKNNLTIIDNGSHMGFLYRKEFIDDLKKTISEAL